MLGDFDLFSIQSFLTLLHLLHIWGRNIVIFSLWWCDMSVKVFFTSQPAVCSKDCQGNQQSIHQSSVLLLLTNYARNPMVNSLRPRQNGRHFADNIFKCIFLNVNFRVSNKISLKYVPWGLINNMTALVQIMAWRRIGDKPLSEAMLVCFIDAYMRHSASMS